MTKLQAIMTWHKLSKLLAAQAYPHCNFAKQQDRRHHTVVGPGGLQRMAPHGAHLLLLVGQGKKLPDVLQPTAEVKVADWGWVELEEKLGQDRWSLGLQAA